MSSELDALVSRESQRIRDLNEGVQAAARFTDCSTTIHRILSSRGNRDLIRRALGPAKLRSWDEEPHLRYELLRGVEPPTIHVPLSAGDSFMRLLLGAPEKPYERTILSSQCLHSTVHVGQRKLLVSEVLFMTMYGSRTNVVVYIGAAGGQHIPALCELFPNHRFLLYDPAPFSRPLTDYMRKNPTRVAVYNELFPPAKGGRSDQELQAATRGDMGFLLISDIRRRDQDAEAPTNADVFADMQLQSDICREMQPKAAHLKCRLPYLDPEANPPEPDIQVPMPKGEIYFQPWCGHKSSETRLIIEPPYSDDNIMTLSARWYESALHYHNLHTRYCRFVVPALTPLEPFVGTVYDACFDCTFERYTIWLYLNSKERAPDYQSFAAIYAMFKRVVGREDERLLQEPSRR